jgi:hypothetical protein
LRVESEERRVRKAGKGCSVVLIVVVVVEEAEAAV